MLIMTPFMYKKLELITPWLLSSFRETKWQIPFSRALFISMFFHHWSSAVKCFWMHWRFNNVCNTWAKITFQTDPHMTPAKELDLSLWDKKFWLEIINLIRGLPDTFFNKSNKYCFDGSCGNDQPNDKDSLKKTWRQHNKSNVCVCETVFVLLLIKLLSFRVVSAQKGKFTPALLSNISQNIGFKLSFRVRFQLPPGGKMPNDFQYWNISHISLKLWIYYKKYGLLEV